MTTQTLTQAVARIVLAPGLVIAVAILVKGYTEVGDGFSAGAVASLTVLVQLVAYGYEETVRRIPLVRVLPTGAVVGLAIALIVALVPVAFGEPILTHRPEPGVSPVKVGTLELITAVAFDLGVFLLVLGAVVGIARTFAIARVEDA